MHNSQRKIIVHCEFTSIYGMFCEFYVITAVKIRQ